MPATIGTSDPLPATLTRRPAGRGFRPAWVGRLVMGSLVPALVLIAWWIASESGWIDPHLLPAPGRVVAAARDAFFGSQQLTLPGVVPYQGAGWLHLGASLRRCLVAFVLAAIIGIAVGFAVGVSRRVASLLDPTLNGLRSVPLYAWLPIMLVWFGIGETAARALIFLGALWPILLATAGAVGRVPRQYLETARMLGTPRRRLWRRVYLPASLPEIVTGLRLGLTWAWMSVTVAELTGATSGLGAMMNAARETSRTDQILVGMFTFAVVGFAADALLRTVTAPLTRWSRT